MPYHYQFKNFTNIAITILDFSLVSPIALILFAFLLDYFCYTAGPLHISWIEKNQDKKIKNVQKLQIGLTNIIFADCAVIDKKESTVLSQIGLRNSLS